MPGREVIPRVVVLVGVVGACVVGAGVSPTLADGKFFGRMAVVETPGIRAQRGVVAYRDGVETLIVQSDLVGEGDAFGWILPLPAPPTAIEPCPAYLFEGMAQALSPRIGQVRTDVAIVLVVFLFLAVLIAADHVYAKQHGKRLVPRTVRFIYPVILLMGAMVFLPSLGTAGAKRGGVDVVQRTQAGVYDVAVLRGESSAVVGDWLNSNGFACPPEVLPVIDEYLADGWCLAAAKVAVGLDEPHAGEGSAQATIDPRGVMAASGEERVVHHPLRFTFPVQEPVYPMRLTGVNAKPLDLDLYVIGEKSASVSGLRAWLSGAFYGANPKKQKNEASSAACYQAEMSNRLRIGVDGVTDLMWPGCVVTRLHGRLDSGDMRSDLTVAWAEAEPAWITVYSWDAALRLSLIVAALVGIVLLIGGALWAGAGNWPMATWVRWQAWVTALVTALVFAGCYFTREVVPVEVGPRAWLRGLRTTAAHRGTLREIEAKGIPDRANFPEAYAARLADEGWTSLRRRERIESFSDYTIERTETGWRVRYLTPDYMAVSVDVSTNGAAGAGGR